MDTALLNVFMDTYAEKKEILCSVVPILYISSTDNSCCTLYRNLGTLL